MQNPTLAMIVGASKPQYRLGTYTKKKVKKLDFFIKKEASRKFRSSVKRIESLVKT